ncbi:MFS transporter [Exophiala viscosa]|uniref:MFS transporter n=1 Tax=Exophiala viscosa TaxID=2486360 RepID=UPI00219A0BCB|nr:MFS transporter [Exophiala viscosa]
MAPVGGKTSQFTDAAVQHRLQLAGKAGPQSLVKNIRVFGIAMFACIGGLLYGYNQGVFSGVLTMTSFGDHMGGYTTNTTKKGWLTSILELGAWTGTLYSGFLAEIISRKYAIIVNTCVFIIGVIVQCTATTAGHNAILGGRFIVGMGVGSLSMIVPMYVAECAPPELRGLLIGLQQFAIEFGIMVSFWIDYGTNYIGGTGKSQSDAAWLVPLALQLAPALVLLVGMIFMPFTPRWLIHHGHEEDARRTLALLRNMPVDNELIELEFLEIKAQSLFEKRTVEHNFPHLAVLTPWNVVKLQFVAIGSLFKTMPMFRRVIVATVTMFFQQWTGINAVLYYAPQIFGSLGLSSNTTSLLATGVVGIAMFLATIPAILYIDKMGRKPTLALGALAMGLCHFIIAIIFAKNQHQWPTHHAAGWAAIVMVWLFVIHFGWSWGPCAWIVVAEVWPLSARPYGIALGASSNWMNNFIVGQVTPDMITGITYGTFILFGVLITIGAAFIWFFVPETKQLTLEEMDLVFGSSGVAVADRERMTAINAEIGLDRHLASLGGRRSDDQVTDVHQEKNVTEKDL